MEINVVKSCKSRLFFGETTCFYWSEMGDSNSRPDGPKPMSEPSDRPVTLFGAFRHSCGSSLELFCPVHFRHRFRLLGFVWDEILYIKSASDRDWLWWRAFLSQRAAQ